MFFISLGVLLADRFLSTVDKVIILSIFVCCVLLEVCNLIAMLSIYIRRLKDLNVSGKVLYIILGGFLILIALDDLQPIEWSLFISSVVFYFWLFFCKGTKGSNRYGPDPLAPSST